VEIKELGQETNIGQDVLAFLFPQFPLPCVHWTEYYSVDGPLQFFV
jgi:hypothetical protein